MRGQQDGKVSWGCPKSTCPAYQKRKCRGSMGAQSRCISQCGEDVTRVPSSDGPSGGLLSSQTQLKTGAQGRERQRRPWRVAEPAKIFMARCLNSLVATEINVPLIFCGFICCESHHFAKVSPFLSLVCPSLD